MSSGPQEANQSVAPLPAMPMQVNYQPSHNAPVPDLKELGREDAANLLLLNGEQKGVKTRQAVGKDDYTFTQARRCSFHYTLSSFCRSRVSYWLVSKNVIFALGRLDTIIVNNMGVPHPPQFLNIVGHFAFSGHWSWRCTQISTALQQNFQEYLPCHHARLPPLVLSLSGMQ